MMGKLEALRASCALDLGGNLGRRLLCRRAPILHKAAAAEQKVQPSRRCSQTWLSIGRWKELM